MLDGVDKLFFERRAYEMRQKADFNRQIASVYLGFASEYEKKIEALSTPVTRVYI